MAATKFRQAIAEPLSRITSVNSKIIEEILYLPKIAPQHQFIIPVPKLLGKEPKSQKQQNVNAICKDLVSKLETNTLIEDVASDGVYLKFSVNPLAYMKTTLHQVYKEKEKYGHHTLATPQTVLIDYSSPNIAKPFHAGHLRSTILGNFIKRIHDANGYNTVGINYLGDWGKQYGLLAIGFDMFGKEEELLKNPIEHLYQVYVQVNALAKENAEIDKKAIEYFKCMEDGDKKALAQWQRFRELSIESYKQIYKRLNIEFDYYSGESQTEPYIQKVYQILNEHSLLEKTEDGASVVNLEKYKLGKPVLQRADGTSLYMTRDLASLLLRRKNFGNFHKAVYVIGTEQELYLKQLFKICELLHHHDSNWPTNLFHAKFGRVMGMSTRKGTAVFLKDILDTAKDHMLNKMTINDQFNKQIIENENQSLEKVADKLGASAVIIQDMAAKRTKNYDFAWDRMTAVKGYTGIYLQYTHARMCGIERQINIPLTIDADVSLLKEREAFELCLAISQFPDITRFSCDAMDPSILVQYMFKLSHVISQANAVIKVKNAETQTAESRRLLFWAAKTTLSNGLKLLGVDPLSRI
ncbi:arginyl-tRNA synthetase [Mycotypha africana]|uniref:arginyl-tRNA synthetase n=1 Tax=Mycotypha africana TaxID=64632 RepID=UPI0022FFD45C|nr:arginyl-tRNA synthetase [Mycotypha africana]KAI8991389.1 arginyl-tRNA synthetase [Mycotypha africana]